MPTVEIVDTEMARLLRGKTEAERLAIGWGMWRSARDMLCNLLRSEHPDWPISDIHREAARRLAHALSALYPQGSEERGLVEAMLQAVPR
jgi:hypothetical protein